MLTYYMKTSLQLALLTILTALALLAPAAAQDAVAIAPAMPQAADEQRMTAEQTLARFRQRNAEQAARIDGYRDHTIITADLPNASQHGEFELERTYTAQPRNLVFQSVSYRGDNFVKSNVIVRYLQSEVDHVTKDDPNSTALSENNYKMESKGLALVNGREGWVFQVKPRKKRAGLFKGRFYLDAQTGALLRMEGRISKSPSFFIRSIDFTQDFEEVDGFVMPTRLQSVTRAHLIGKAIVTVLHKAYKITLSPVTENASAITPAITDL